MDRIKAWWAGVKAWFKNSETIFWARFQVFGGLLLAVIPTLNPVAWLDSALSRTQQIAMAATAIINGLLTEFLRRRNATDLGPPK